MKSKKPIGRCFAVLAVGISSLVFANVNLLAYESTASSGMARNISPDSSLQSPASQNVSSSFGKHSKLYGLVVDSNDNIYVVDSTQSTIFKISKSGSRSVYSGSPKVPGYRDGPSEVARFNLPDAISIDAKDNIYVADSGNRIIRKISSDGLVSTVAGVPQEAGDADGGPQQAKIDYVRGLAIAVNCSVYFIDFDTVRVLNGNGEIHTVAGSPLARRNPYVPVDSEIDGPGHAVRFNRPAGIAITAGGDLYVTDRSDATIRKISAEGVVTTVAGKAMNFGNADGKGSAARFDIPTGIMADESGNLFVADSRNHTVRKISPEGLVSTFAGDSRESATRDGVGKQARFIAPHGLAFDKHHNLYVSDIGCSCIRKIAPDAAVSTVEFSDMSE